MAQSIAIKETPFQWEGVDGNGKKVKGKSLAQSEAAVRAELRRRGVVANPKIRKQSTLFQKQGKVTPADIAIFSRQLATMLTAGIPLVQAFDIVGNGHENPAMQKLMLAIKADVEGGTSLADALARHPLHFDELFVNLVTAGEQAGALEIAARQDRDLQGKDGSHQEKDQESVVLPDCRYGSGSGRDDDSADLRDSGIRIPLPGLRR